ncbi:MAG: siroheme synthase CysG [Pseudomonadota bacterium]
MQHFPIFVNLRNARVVLSGGGEAALAKLRLLMKTEAAIEVFSPDPSAEIIALAEAGKLTLMRRALEPWDVIGATLFYGADEDPGEDARTTNIARAEGALINIVDNLADSAFITPAIVDRDPVVVAIGTEGAAPVLARAIKRDIEEKLPSVLGLLARVGKAFRPMAERLPFGRARRDFWADYYFKAGPRAVEQGDAKAINGALDALLDRHLARQARPGHIAFVGAGPGDPDLLTLKARKALDEADVVIYDRLVAPEILELARREAVMIEAGKTGFGPSKPQEEINALATEHAGRGAQVVRLKSGDGAVFGRLDEEIDAADAAGIAWSIVPGITAASAAAAALGQSLTRRGRNASIQLITAHDMAGFADHDWRALAEPGAVAALYMGKRAARFVQGRMLMHGSDRDTPVTFVENASRPDQRIIAAQLHDMADKLAAAECAGPVLTFLGLAPREAARHAEQIAAEKTPQPTQSAAL